MKNLPENFAVNCFKHERTMWPLFGPSYQGICWCAEIVDPAEDGDADGVLVDACESNPKACGYGDTPGQAVNDLMAQLFPESKEVPHNRIYATR